MKGQNCHECPTSATICSARNTRSHAGCTRAHPHCPAAPVHQGRIQSSLKRGGVLTQARRRPHSSGGVLTHGGVLTQSLTPPSFPFSPGRNSSPMLASCNPPLVILRSRATMEQHTSKLLIPGTGSLSSLWAASADRQNSRMFPASAAGPRHVGDPCAWVFGEFCCHSHPPVMMIVIY